MTRVELYSVLSLQTELEKMERCHENLLAVAEDLVPARNGMPHSTDVKSRVESLGLKLAESSRSIEQLRDRLIKAKVDLTLKIISEVADPVLQKIAILRYVKGLTTKEISRKMGYALRHTFKLHEKFLKAHVHDN